MFTSFFCIEPKQNTSRDCSSSFQVFSTASGRRLLPEVFLSSPVSDAAVGEDPNTFVVDPHFSSHLVNIVLILFGCFDAGCLLRWYAARV